MKCRNCGTKKNVILTKDVGWIPRWICIKCIKENLIFWQNQIDSHFHGDKN